MAAPSTAQARALPDHAPVRRIGPETLRAALREGFRDFMAKRGDLIFLGVIYPLVGFVTALASLGNSVLPLLFPFLAGLSLLGPLVSTGFYELARRREIGLESRWRHFFDILRSSQIDQILVVGAILIGIFLAWIFSAAAIYGAFFGTHEPVSLATFLHDVLTTERGWTMMIIGNLVGLCFAALAMVVSVISLPMLVDKDVDAGMAIRTSFHAVRENPAMMARWGMIVGVILFIAAIPAFLGLAVALPVLGYATWHLYTKIVDRTGLRSAA